MPRPPRRFDGQFPSGRPLKVEGGITARSTRGAIGDSWWSRRFLAALEALAIGGRLARGKTYARQGQVLGIELSAGAVRASVQGSRARPYRVDITLAPFPDELWERVERALAGQAIYSARLLAGEMPPDIDELFATAGAPLFPQRAGDLGMSCSCPDWERPCKHLAAVFYLLAERFDDDPFTILEWRGRDRAALTARLRELRAGMSSGPPDAPAAAGPVTGAGAALTDLPEPEGAAPERFWLSPVPLPARPPVLDAGADLLLRQLPEPGPGLGGQALVASLRVAYRRFGSADPG